MKGVLSWVTIGRLSGRPFCMGLCRIWGVFGFGVTLGVTVRSDKMKS
nr:MAG TPA: hypothetical protein [Caudoviricetes sp.]